MDIPLPMMATPMAILIAIDGMLVWEVFVVWYKLRWSFSGIITEQRIVTFIIVV